MKTCSNILCRKVHSNRRSGLCNDCQTERNTEINRAYEARRAEHHSFYNSKEWKELRLIKLSMNPACELCFANGRFITKPLIVHHIIEVADDWSERLTLSNLQTVCRSCHNKLHGLNGGPTI